MAGAVRDALDRRRLQQVLATLDDELGVLDDEDVARVGARFDEIDETGRATGR